MTQIMTHSNRCNICKLMKQWNWWMKTHCMHTTYKVDTHIDNRIPPKDCTNRGSHSENMCNLHPHWDQDNSKLPVYESKNPPFGGVFVFCPLHWLKVWCAPYPRRSKTHIWDLGAMVLSQLQMSSVKNPMCQPSFRAADGSESFSVADF